ncbi:hypothetical protein C8F01DRAFT_1365868 [Mycena amicta]|nr:hypothetical protein C8F01DRAFT_1365868 [Mycena amicta]
MDHPIHNLPAELVARIFVHCLPLLPDPTALTSVCKLSSQRAPLLLTRVCGLWRLIALRTPALWSTITLELFSPTQGLDEMLAFWLANGREHPLDLYMHYRQRLTTDRVPSLLAASAKRWRDVDLFLHPTALAALSAAAEASSVAEYGHEQESFVDLPQLRRLSLGCLPSSAGGQDPVPITFFTSAPLLTDVALVKISPVPARVVLPWAQLTSFSIECPDVRASLSVLRLAPALQHLCIQIECPSGGLAEESRSSFRSTPAASANTTIRVLLAYLPFMLPSLRTLVLPVLAAADVPSLVAFAQRVPALQSLTMALAPLPPGALYDALKAFKLRGQLRELELRYITEGTLCELFDRLAEKQQNQDHDPLDASSDSESTPTFLPYLQSLHIDSFRSTLGVPYAALFTALHARAFTFTMSPHRISIYKAENENELLLPLEAPKVR